MWEAPQLRTSPKAQLGSQLHALVVRAGQAVGSAMAVMAAFVISALVAFIPLTALPGELQTNFVRGSWIAPVWIGIFLVLLTVRLGRLANQRDQPWWPSTRSFMWRTISTFVVFFWVTGGLLWINAFGVTKGREHEMRVAGQEDVGDRRAVSTIRYYKLAEVGTSWRADLQSDYGLDNRLKVGDCVRITVRSGRLGLDWISDAHPTACPRPGPDVH